MSEAQNIALIKKVYELFGKHDIQGLLGLCADDIHWHTPGFPKVPYAGDFKSRAEVGKFFEGLGKTAEFERFEPRDFIAQNDRVAVLGFYSGKGRHTKRPFSTDWTMVFTIRSGKVAAFQEFFDTQNLGSAFA